ncbi:hypothetical protein Rmet_3903 (plasmid) [Cupriavidus metallidurans CH34]|uniref:Uncharacterized protein n=1 Tax=Cupriavidus metallidurans (strain ATCC 43123 / DSM 2839 / NBRC 102507 / CH34) TaxID=266264 RepID=Q1LGF5_CUPMC|nr:hypothetical protein Rmet_3903 [Cupriavidus metallidurans CH34]
MDRELTIDIVCPVMALHVIVMLTITGHLVVLFRSDGPLTMLVTHLTPFPHYVHDAVCNSPTQYRYDQYLRATRSVSTQQRLRAPSCNAPIARVRHIASNDCAHSKIMSTRPAGSRSSPPHNALTTIAATYRRVFRSTFSALALSNDEC